MEWIELGELGRISTGNTPSKNKIEYYNEDYIGLVKPSNFNQNKITNIEFGEEYLSKEGKSKGRVAEVGDVLITCIGKIGNVGIAFKEVCFNQQINSIKVNKSKVSPKYLAYSILYIKPTLNHMANKAVVPIINKSMFEKLKIPVPQIEIQKQIVEVLDKAQDLIDKRKEQIKLLDELIESIFYYMFGDPVRNDRGWEFKNLGTVTNFIDYRGKTPLTQESGVLIITAKNVGAREFREKPIEYISEELYDERMTRGFPKANDVLFVTEGATMGFVCRVPKNIGRFSVGQRIITLVGKDLLQSEYLHYIIANEIFQGEVNRRATGSSAKGIRASELKKIEIPIPPISLQNQFASKVEAIEKQKSLLEESLKLMEDNYKSLMQRAFKGDLF